MNRKYVTPKMFTGKTYSEVAEIMTRDGYKMNHSSVRNYVTNGFIKIIRNISREYEVPCSYEEAKLIAQRVDFQESIVEIMKRES
jgi:hypothetical protein